MADELSRRIEGCIAAETGCAEVYRMFGSMLPEARDFWDELAREEENHAAILAVGRGFQKAGKLTEEVVPVAFPMANIQGTIDLAREIKAKARDREISMEEALGMALSLEETLCESYFEEVRTNKGDSRFAAALQRLLIHTRSHMEKIREVISKSGFKERGDENS
jgi:rubrerythrin